MKNTQIPQDLCFNLLLNQKQEPLLRKCYKKKTNNNNIKICKNKIKKWNNKFI